MNLQKNELLKKIKKALGLLGSAPILATGLLAIVVTLILSSFVSQLNLQKNSLDELMYKTETYGKSLSYFYNERLKDVVHLAKLTEIKTYFDNVALGMTLKYGLLGSINNIEEKFNQFVSENTVQMKAGDPGKEIYAAVFLLTTDGKILAKSKTLSKAMVSVINEHKRELLENRKDPAVKTFKSPGTGDEIHEFVTIPYWHKGKYSGQITAKMNPGIFFDRFIKDSGYLLSTDGFPIGLEQCSSCMTGKIDGAAFAKIWDELKKTTRYIEFVAPDKTSFLGVRTGITHTPFQLVKLISRHEVLGRVSPWALLIGMTFLLVLIGIGARMNFKNRALRLAAEQKTLQAELKAAQKDKALIAALQVFLLPHQPFADLEKIKVGGFYRPAAEASGDWWSYRYFPKENILNITVGDVTGHGPASAMCTATVAASFRRLTKDKSIRDLEGILKELNEDFTEFTQGQYFMTFTAVNFDLTSNKVDYWNAGAPPISRINKETGDFSFVMARGNPLGSQDFKLGHEELDVKPGDRFFFLTDGITELNIPGGRMLREKSLIQMLTQTKNMNVKDGIQHIQTELDNARQQIPLNDDLTLAIVDLTSVQHNPTV